MQDPIAHVVSNDIYRNAPRIDADLADRIGKAWEIYGPTAALVCAWSFAPDNKSLHKTIEFLISDDYLSRHWVVGSALCRALAADRA